MARTYQHMGQARLRDWASVEIEDDEANEAKRVTLISKLHVGNRFPITWSYSDSFTDHEILADGKLIHEIQARFGVDVFVGSIRI